MRKFFVYLIFLFAILTFCVGISSAIEGMITRIDNTFIYVNKGIESKLQPGTILYITRLGQPIGTLRVEQVDSYRSICRTMEKIGNHDFCIGDLASTESYTKPAATTGVQTGKTAPVLTTAPKEGSEKERIEAQLQYEKKVMEQYESVIKKHTCILQFKKGPGGVVQVNGWSIVSLLMPAIYQRPYFVSDYLTLGDIALTTIGRYKASQRPEDVRNVTMEVTYWDVDYLDAFASYYAYKESSTDPRTINTIKENIYRQKGLDKFYVFQVKLYNPGPGMVQLAPFPLHFFIEGKERQIHADSYDEILDKTLNPNQSVNGYIYFSRNDQHGQPINQGTQVTVSIVDVVGSSSKVNFKD
jgi:hypothetical protein